MRERWILELTRLHLEGKKDGPGDILSLYRRCEILKASSLHYLCHRFLRNNDVIILIKPILIMNLSTFSSL